ncbi:MAG: hypothetical protein ACPH5P_02240 [Akkermansiaceae bacterium]
MKRMKYIILAALAIAVTSAHAGRGCMIVVPGAGSQIQHASHAQHTFAVGEMHSYKITKINYCLKTMDASSPGNMIVLTNNGQHVADIVIPLERKKVEEGEILLDVTLQGDINLNFDFQHAASAFGAIALCVEYIENAPEASGSLTAPSYANTDEKPNIDWSALISVKTETSVTDVSGSISGAQSEADNAGNTKTTKSN